jgi:hypothetical protein
LSQRIATSLSAKCFAVPYQGNVGACSSNKSVARQSGTAMDEDLSQLLKTLLIMDQQWTYFELSREKGIASHNVHAILMKELKMGEVRARLVQLSPAEVQMRHFMETARLLSEHSGREYKAFLHSIVRMDETWTCKMVNRSMASSWAVQTL